MKLKHLLFLIIVVFHNLQVISIGSDTLIGTNDLTFNSEAEKQAFLSISAQKQFSDFLDLLLVSFDNNKEEFNRSGIQRKIDDCVDHLRAEVADKSEVKKVRYIYDYVHKTFFKVYKLKNKFPDIFDKGEYNCVSATALYAIIFSKLSIPYQIKEMPEHVYLVAYPNSAKVLIETTVPNKGYYTVNDQYQKQYVKYLYNSKAISSEEYENTETSVLFNKYGFSSEDITLRQLIGVQHSNYGLYLSEDKNYEVAISEFKKAYFLYPCERHKFSLKSLLVYQVANNNYSDSKQLNNLLILCRYNNLKDNEISNENIKGEFERILNIQLINNSDYKGFENSYTAVYNEIADTLLKNEISFLYHVELARLGLVNLKNSKSELIHLQAAYRINPNNANLQGLILSCFKNSIYYENSDASVAIDLMTDYADKFSFLNDNSDFIALKATCILELSYQSFYLNELTKGENFLNEFEELCGLEKEFKPNPAFVEKAYAVAASSYYKKGNFSKSKQFLKKGLLYAPNSFGLKQRLSQFN